MLPRRAQLASLVVFLAVLSACGPTSPGKGGGFPDVGGGLVRIPTPPGDPVARPTAVAISPSGGTIKTADGSLTITVPPGAVPSEMVFTVTPIANTARGAIGGAYRLGPEGLTFATPVTLTFKAPETYPKGVSIAGVGVEYQDRRGYWHRVEGVTHDSVGKTVTVATDHFSDWALTWQMGTAAAEGPIKLTQTVGIPFTAFGRATVFLQGDDATDTTYLLTGTLTVPDTITVNDEVCTPDQKTKTLPPNVGEIHKGNPPVFRWGIGVTWSLSCKAPSGAVTTRLMPAMFDTMYINLTRCGGYYEPGQVAESDHIEGAYTSNCGVEGVVSATWNLRACVPGVQCQAEGVCRAGTTMCTDGVQSCVDYGASPNGTVCGPTNAEVCSEGQCVDLNDQAIGFTISPSGTTNPLTGPLTTTEEGGTATFDFVLNKQPTTDVTIALSTDSIEGTVSPTTLTFTPANWQDPQLVTVTGHDDHVVDGDVSYNVVTARAVAGDPRYNGLDPEDVQVTNVDDDVAGFVVDPEGGLVTDESGKSAKFTIALTSQPIADVTVPLSSSKPTEGTVSPPSVTFTPGTWNVAQEITVTGVDDLVADGDVAYAAVTGPATSSDPMYQGRDAGDVAVTNADNDSAGITVSPTSGLQTTEAGGTATFTIVLHSQPTADVTIPLRVSNGEAMVSLPSVTFTAGDWNVPKEITVTGLDDKIDDDAQPFTVITDPALGTDLTYAGMDAADVQGSNANDDAAGIKVSTSGGLVTTEAGGSAVFTVVLTSEPRADVTIPLSSSDETEGIVSPAAVTFTPTNWSTPQTVTVTGVDDAVADGVQEYFAQTGISTSGDTKYNGLDASDVGVTNGDNDVVGIDVTVPASTETAEAGGSVTLSVVLRSQPTADVTIPFTSSDTTEGTVSPAALTFTAANWNQAQTVTIAGANDSVVDGPQTYVVTRGAATSGDAAYAAVPPADFTFTNTDDDTPGVSVSAVSGDTTEGGGPATFTVVLRSEPAADVTIGITSSDTTEGTVAPGSVTFTSLNWNVPQTITVTGVDDAADDGDVTYTISIGAASSGDPVYSGKFASSLTLKNLDDDAAAINVSAISGPTGEPNAQATFTISLATPPTADVTIPLRSSDAGEGTVPASVTFTPANWNIAQTVTVTGADDSVMDGTVAYAIITDPATSADQSYGGLNAADVAVSNLDDDMAGITVFPASGLSTSEDGTEASFTVVLASQPTANVVFTVASTDGTEGIAAPASLTFTPANWNVAQTVRVTGQNDDVADGPQPYAVVVTPSSSDAAYGTASPITVQLVNEDNDSAGVIVSAEQGIFTTEGGGEARFTVVLTSEPTSPVTISVASSVPTEGSVSPSELTFTAANWRTAQTVTVSGVNDSVVDGDQPYVVVTGDTVSGDLRYSGLAVADVSLTNHDDDVAPIVGDIVVTPPLDATIASEGGTAAFSVALTAQPTLDVVIPVVVALDANGLLQANVSLDGVTLASALNLTFTPLNWNEAQTVIVTALADTFAVETPYTVQVLPPLEPVDPAYVAIDPADVALVNAATVP